jgi:hypothetical protein
LFVLGALVNIAHAAAACDSTTPALSPLADSLLHEQHQYAQLMRYSIDVGC